MIKRAIKTLVRTLKAHKFLKKLQRRYSNCKILFAFPHLGDIAIGLSYLEQIDDRKVVVAPEHMAKIVELYRPYCYDVIYMNKTLFDACYKTCLNMFSFIYSKYKNIIVAYPYYYFREGINDAITGSALMAIRYAYGLNPEKEYHITRPVITPLEDAEIKKILGSPDIDLNKVAIVSPYAQSAPDLSECYWDEIVNTLTLRGFNVYSNVTETQKELKYTSRLDCTLEELYNICRRVKSFIGVRSGIMDFIVTTGCNIFSIYTSRTQNRSYNLQQWGMSNIYNYFCIDGMDNLMSAFSEYVEEIQINA